MLTTAKIRSRVPSAPTATPACDPIILVGNPNVGKSVLFKNLTRRYVTVSNFPGTTVEITRARGDIDGRSLVVIDTPGVNDLEPMSDEARVTCELLAGHDRGLVVQVADAKNLRRALVLTLQLAELGHPMVLVLNMLDELEERGGVIDMGRLSEILGVPVVGTVATRNEGTADLVSSIGAARPPQHASPARAGDTSLYDQRRVALERVNEILRDTYRIAPPDRASLRVRLGLWAMHPVKGLAVLAVVLLGVFWFVGLFGAGTLVDLVEVGGFQQRVVPLAIRAVDGIMPFPHQHEIEAVAHPIGLPVSPVHEVSVGTITAQVVQPEYTVDPGVEMSVLQSVARFIHDLLVGQYGTITMALSYAFAIVLPIVTTFFLVFALLEDSGYFPRMAIMVHRLFRVMGLNGRAVLPMVLGLGCDTMATMTTRILGTRKERLVTTMLLALAVPCSAQLGVLLALMAVLSPVRALVWLGLVGGILVLVGWLTARVIPGETSEFILEIPPMRWPQMANVLTKALGRLNWYLREVVPLFVIGTAFLFMLDTLRLLDNISRLGKPLVVGWLGLPSEMATVFLVGFLRRDFGAVYVLDAVTGPTPLLTPHQILVAMVTITLFMPCIANFLMIAKEHGLKIAWSMALFIFPFAFLVGGVVHRVGTWLTSI